MSKVWFITGASKGFGREFALGALERGDRVAATARNTDTLSGLVEQYGDAVLPIELDVTDRDPSFDVEEFRRTNPDLVTRREQEVQLLERHMGRMSFSELLPASEPELAAYRPELVRRLDAQPQRI
jgi:NADP-dependent 3-hydroxy acid dehydrogenase YdfG